MKIIDIRAIQIFDSNGFPAISVEVVLSNNEQISTFMPQALLGCEIEEAANFINKELKRVLLDEAENPIDVDSILIDLDGTEHRTNLGKGLMLLVSMSMYKAYARVAGQDLFDYIATLGGYESISLPIPLISILGKDNLFEGYFAVPYGAKSIKNALEATSKLVESIDMSMDTSGNEHTINECGAFDNENKTYSKSLKFLDSKIKEFKDVFTLGIDANLSNHYDSKKGIYRVGRKNLKYSEMIDFYKELLETYNILFIEDALDSTDWEGWINLNITVENSCNLVANDVVKSQLKFLSKAIEYDIASTISVDPYKIGTITETIQMVKLCQQYSMAVSLDVKVEETTETFYADLAVGCSANYTKFGGLVGSEHTSKYNRLLAIENILIDSFS